MIRLPPDAPILDADAMRAAERRAFGSDTTAVDLMERAGAAIAVQVRRLALGRPVAILAGPGNNGGDAFVAARYCRAWGLDVVVGTFADVAENRRRQWSGATVPLADLPPRPVLVDGLFGIGLSRPLTGAATDAFAALAAAADLVIAIDLPSGADADAVRDFVPPVRADVTIALGALKPAHVVGPFAGHCGTVLLETLDLAIESDVRVATRPRLTSPGRMQHKFDRGMVAIIGGAMAGAARLSARAALGGGAGYVVLVAEGGDGSPDALVRRPPSAVDELRTDKRVSAMVIGPGLCRTAEAREMLDRVLDSDRTLVIDGDALSLLGADATERLCARTSPTILTPHEGEFARMFGAGAGNKIERTRAAARATGAVVVHKGADTVIAGPDGAVRVLPLAVSWLSTAGSGDVLTGVVAARLAGSAPFDAAVAGAWLHARAAALTGPAFTADDLIPALRMAIPDP